MRGILVAPLVAGLLFTAAPAAQAQTQTPGIDPCGIPARAPARASLAESLMYTPMGYGPFGWAPLVAPWGPVDPAGGAAIFGPPGPVANAGPLGPGLTANAIAASIVANGGTPTPSQQVDLASQQQTELGTLLSRYTLGGQLQLAGATWAIGLPARASAERTILTRMCHNQQAESVAAGAASGTSGTGSGAGGSADAAPTGSQP
ncbi:MAG TPA: hypothetical protein VII06_23990 [Chloroflexota bacterium]